MSERDTILLCQQVELTADTLIEQLVQIKDFATKLRHQISSMPGVSTLGLPKGQSPLTDQQISELLVTRQKRRKKHS